MRGYLKTTILMAGLVALFGAVGFALGGQQGMVIALVMAAATNAFAYWNSDKVVLRMYGAREVDALSSPNYYAIVRDLAARAKLPMPRVYIMENDQPNAFATGRDPQHAAVAATTGLLARLDSEEIAAVMAHELGHVKNRDTLIMTVTATVAGAISMLAHFAGMFRYVGINENGRRLNPLAMMIILILAPLAAMLIQFAISRSREFEADKAGAEISGHPEHLASALEKIAARAAVVPNIPAEHNPETAHLFIANPLRGGGLQSLFSTHPAMEERVRRLRAMAKQNPSSFRWLSDNDDFGPGNSGNPWQSAAE